MLRFRRDDVATTPSATTGIGHRRRGPARPPRNALRRFTLVRHHNTPMASSRPALTEAPAAHNQAALETARSIPGRALASSMLDSPYQGSRTGLTPPISTPVPSTPGGSPTGSPPAPYRSGTIARWTEFFSLVVGMNVSFVQAYTDPRTLPDKQLCIDTCMLLGRTTTALLAATGAIPLARWDGPGVTGFVRREQRL
jgi:hypothetical protein